MVEVLMDNGKKIKSMVRVYIFGQTEENMKENIKMIKRMVLAHINGLMAKFLKANGLMENNMEKESL